jgi:hypothetical protein
MLFNSRFDRICENIKPIMALLVGFTLVGVVLYIVGNSLYESSKPIEVTVYSDGQVYVFQADRSPALSNGFAYIHTHNGRVVLRADRMEWSRK